MLIKTPNIRSEIRKWLETNQVSNPVNVTLTEKQYLHKTVGKDKRIFKLDEFKSSQNFRHFKNVLNRKIFGNGYRRFKKQLQMLVVREVSPQTNRLHLHLIIEQPTRYNFLNFSNLIRRTWINCDFGFTEIHIEKPTDQSRTTGWFNYIMKSDIENTIDWNNTFLSDCRL